MGSNNTFNSKRVNKIVEHTSEQVWKWWTRQPPEIDYNLPRAMRNMPRQKSVLIVVRALKTGNHAWKVELATKLEWLRRLFYDMEHVFGFVLF